jgi:hypothetical protein
MTVDRYSHRWLKTVNRFYNQARLIEAATAVQANLLRRRWAARRATRGR